MARRDDAENSWLAWIETALWVTASLLGPIPWLLLATRELERFWGTTGYSVAFIGAPALWCGLATAAFLAQRRRWVIGVALLGALIWWTPFG